MSDDLDKRGGNDRHRISFGQKHQVEYGSREVGVSEKQLRDAIAAVGKMVTDVRAQLKG